MNNIKAIVFDLGNVLIPFDYNILLNNLDVISEGLGQKFYNRYKDNYHVHRSYEKWELSDDEFLSIMLNWTEGKLDKEKFCELYSNLFTVNHDVVSLLPRLKMNYKLVLLSNTNHIHQKYGWEKYKFLEYFDKLILSHEVGAVKPEEKIYNAVMEFTKFNPESHLFIDDIREYVDGAMLLGWDAIQFVNYKNLVENLKIRDIQF